MEYLIRGVPPIALGVYLLLQGFYLFGFIAIGVGLILMYIHYRVN